MKMHRTQILLEEEQYRRLKQASEETGRSIGAIVRAAVGEHLADGTVDSFLAALDESFGAWDEQDFDGRDWVDRARGGLDRPIGAMAWR
ncbi:MAG: ribbon-helix-helix protein, CopG family [Euzebyales bacterium]|nr:ribbon-helix-helix protein, CopG family [Euzebyales bacterium]